MVSLYGSLTARDGVPGRICLADRKMIPQPGKGLLVFYWADVEADDSPAVPLAGFCLVGNAAPHINGARKSLIDTTVIRRVVL